MVEMREKGFRLHIFWDFLLREHMWLNCRIYFHRWQISAKKPWCSLWPNQNFSGEVWASPVILFICSPNFFILFFSPQFFSSLLFFQARCEPVLWFCLFVPPISLFSLFFFPPIFLFIIIFSDEVWANPVRRSTP